MSFIVVGGGIFGLFTAYHLVNEGIDVIIIEQDEPGNWSRTAAGLIEYRIFSSNLINAPGYIIRFLKMMRSNKAMIRYVDTSWLLNYLRRYGREIPSELIDALRAINDSSRNIYRKLSEEKNDFEYSEEPYLEVASNIEEAIKEAKTDPLNPKFEVTEFMGKEALMFHDTAKLSTDLLIARLLRELNGKVKLIKALAWDISNDTVWLSNGDALSGDTIMVTAGYWPSTLGVPVMPFRGFGIRVKANVKVSFPISIDDLGIFIMSFNNWLKITSRFDPDCGLNTMPLKDIIKGAKSVIGDFSIVDVSIGYRPCTPDGLPIIDRISERVYVATGGCRLGWTQAPGATKLLVDLALGRVKQTPFRLNRFINSD